MKHSHLFVVACIVAVSVSSLVAQERAVLSVEITKDGTLAAAPQLRVQSGREGRIDVVVDDDWRGKPLLKGMRETIQLRPTVQGDELAIAFNITTGGKPNELATRRCDAPIDPADACEFFNSTVVISKAIQGSVEWRSATAGQIRLTVSWVE